jgi:hypothetical protein
LDLDVPQSYVSEVADKNLEFMATALNLVANVRTFNAFIVGAESFQDDYRSRNGQDTKGQTFLGSDVSVSSRRSRRKTQITQNLEESKMDLIMGQEIVTNSVTEQKTQESTE